MANHTPKTDTQENQLSELIKKRQFEEAEMLLKSAYPESQIIRVLHQLAEQSTGLLTYTFAHYLIQKYNTSFWHKVAAVIASESLDHVVEGHNAGLYHILKAIELNPTDWLLQESALGFYAKGLLDRSQALSFAQEVLKHEPTNKLAAKIMNE